MDQVEITNFEHDLRNLFAAMQNAVEVIRFDVGLSKDSTDMLAIFDRQLGLSLQLVSRFCGQVDAGSAELASNPKPESPQLDEQNSCDAAAIQQLDVLIVDDTRMAAYMLQRMLEQLGQSVRACSSGALALAAISERRPDLIFSDIRMAEMNGYQLARKIRALPSGNGIRLVALTGSSSIDARKDSIESGFDEHIEKPMTIVTLKTLLMLPPTSIPSGDFEI